MEESWKNDRNKIIGLGENSFRKSYYPELQSKLEELEISRKNLDTIINSTSDGIVIHDISGKILFLNTTAQKLLNISENEKETVTVADISSDKNSIHALQKIWENVKNNNPRTIEWVVLQNETNKEILVQVSINITLWNGKQAFVAVIRDFTERKEYEEKLLKEKERAEESDRLKTAFLQNISHEIRTPMNAIVGFSDLINDPDLSPELRKEYTHIISVSSNQLLSIVDNILTISTLETKQERVEIQPVNINSLMFDLFSIYKKQASSRNLTIEVKNYLDDSSAEIFTDKIKLNQILANLLNNSIKFTANGKIEFGYNLENNLLIFFVKDTGIGIPHHMQSKIFKRFVQGAKDTHINYGGAGLGLAISKEFVELLGGKIWVESEISKGSVFYFSIKYLPVQKKTPAYSDIKMQIQNSPTILIAEDEDYNYKYLESLLERSGSIILHTKNGQEAVNICKSNSTIDLVLMDIKMPVMDGLTAARLIKVIRPDLPIIAQTAYALEHEIIKYRGLNFDDYIIKPINKEELYNKMLRFVRIE